MLQLVKGFMQPWGLKPELKGVDALECCAAAAAQLQARGELWSPYGLARAYAKVKGLNHETVWKNMAGALKRAGLPGPAETIRFLAELADFVEATAYRFQGRL